MNVARSSPGSRRAPQGRHRLPRRPAVGHVDPARHRRRLADPPVLDRLHARRRAVHPVLRVPQPVRRLDARCSCSGRASSSPSSGGRASGSARTCSISFWFERNARRGRGQEGVRHQPRRRLRVHDRDVLDLRVARQRSTTRRWTPGARRDSRAAPPPRSRCCCSSAHRQERADPAAHLAARRDGGPDAGLGADPRRDDGDRRRVPRRAARTRSSSVEQRRARRRRVGRRRSPRCSRARSRSCSPTSSACSRTPRSASSATCSSRSASARTAPRSSS